jgi:RNA recognition motif-containing protein
MNIFVGNLHALTTAGQLSNLFLQFGRVISSKIAMDFDTGHSLGFGFIVMDSHSGDTAIQQLNNRYFLNTYLEVNETAYQSITAHQFI